MTSDADAPITPRGVRGSKPGPARRPAAKPVLVGVVAMLALAAWLARNRSAEPAATRTVPPTAADVRGATAGDASTEEGRPAAGSARGGRSDTCPADDPGCDDPLGHLTTHPPERDLVDLAVRLGLKFVMFHAGFLPHEKSDRAFQDIPVDFLYFFSRKMMFVRFASAYVVLPGGFGTLDELSECLTLVQTGKSRRIPIILVGSSFWRGLVDWMREKLVGEGMVGEHDLDLMQVIDDPDETVEAIFRFYEGRGFQPTQEERERMLNL